MKTLVGTKIWRLEIIALSSEKISGKSIWVCKCNCGNITKSNWSNIKHGKKKSCGCLKKEIGITYGVRHGHARIGGQSAEYVCWINMLARCSKPESSGYKNYGGRGIRVCNSWTSFENFIADMGNKPSSKHSIERKNNNGNYEPSNCVWATRLEQNKNKRNVRIIEFNGRSKSISEWAIELGIPMKTLRARIVCYKWPLKRAMLTPVGLPVHLKNSSTLKDSSQPHAA